MAGNTCIKETLQQPHFKTTPLLLFFIFYFFLASFFGSTDAAGISDHSICLVCAISDVC